MPIIAFLTNDLVFQSRIANAAKEANLVLVVDRDHEKLIAKLSDGQAVRLVIVDLSSKLADLQESYSALRSHCPEASLVAYAPHVHESKLDKARELGFDQVLTRGQFDRAFLSLISEATIDR